MTVKKSELIFEKEECPECGSKVNHQIIKKDDEYYARFECTNDQCNESFEYKMLLS